MARISYKALAGPQKVVGAVSVDITILMFGAAATLYVCLRLLGELHAAVLLILGLIGMLLSAWAGLNRARQTDLRILDFARQNGFSNIARWHAESLGSLLSFRGLKARRTAYVSGLRNGLPFQTYEYVFKRDNNRLSASDAILVIELRGLKDLPHVFVDNTSNNRFYDKQFDRKLIQEDVIEVGGSHNQHFNIYAAADYELESLLLADQELLSAILDKAPHFDVEFIDGRVYAYGPESAFTTKLEQYQQAYELLDTLTTLLPAKMARWRFTKLYRTPTTIKTKQYMSDKTEDTVLTIIAWLPMLVAGLIIGGMAYSLYIITESS